MPRLCVLLLLALGFVAAADSAPPHAVGFLHLEITDPVHALTFPALVLYPAKGPPAATPLALGPFAVNATPGAAPAEGRFPVTIISHGRTGTNLGYFTIAEHLAANGHIVALPLHHRDNYLDGSQAEADLTLELRPRHISLTLDAIAASKQIGAHADPNRAAVIGHSMGGYTALAVAGGRALAREGQPVASTPDRRVQALVLLAPATFWYDHDAGLSAVTTPILLLTAEHDQLTPGTQAAAILRRSLPATTPVTHEDVTGAGHFSFLAPFPDVVRAPDFEPAIDPDGFDRAAFHRHLPERILTFLQDFPRDAKPTG